MTTTQKRLCVILSAFVIALTAAWFAVPPPEAAKAQGFARGNFFENIKVVPILSYASAATDRNSEVIDTRGYGRCMIVVHLAAVADAGANNFFLKSADAASNETTLTSGADVLGSSQTILGTDDDKAKYIDFAPDKRFYQLTMNKDATNLCAESAVVYLYQTRVARPVTHGAGGTTIGEGTGAVAGENLNLATQGTQ